MPWSPGVPPSDDDAVDTVWLDLSKGLGCPVGGVLAGSKAFIDEAWRWKHRLGGAIRQSGMVAATGLYALDHNVERLAEDHATPGGWRRMHGNGIGACRSVPRRRDQHRVHRSARAARPRRRSSAALLPTTSAWASLRRHDPRRDASRRHARRYRHRSAGLQGRAERWARVSPASVRSAYRTGTPSDALPDAHESGIPHITDWGRWTLSGWKNTSRRGEVCPRAR